MLDFSVSLGKIKTVCHIIFDGISCLCGLTSQITYSKQILEDLISILWQYIVITQTIDGGLSHYAST